MELDAILFADNPIHPMKISEKKYWICFTYWINMHSFISENTIYISEYECH